MVALDIKCSKLWNNRLHLVTNKWVIGSAVILFSVEGTQRYKKTFNKSEMVTKLNKKIIRNRTSSLPGLYRNRWGRAVDSSPAFFASVNILGLQMTWILYEFHRLKNAYSCIWFFASYPLKMVCTVLPQSDHVHDALESNFRKSQNSWLEEILRRVIRLPCVVEFQYARARIKTIVTSFVRNFYHEQDNSGKWLISSMSILAL